jgi:D-3-phosphoglycerate dehydrogenase
MNKFCKSKIIHEIEMEKFAQEQSENKIRSKLFLTEDFFTKCSSLHWVARAGAGMDNIDEVAAFRAGVTLMNSENANSDAVGEQTLAMLLALRTNLVKSHNEVSRGIWNREGNRGIELKGKTVGIIGYGNTGKAVCEKLSGFGVNILVYDKYKSKFSDTNLTEVKLDEILAKSDVISLLTIIWLKRKVNKAVIKAGDLMMAGITRIFICA